MTSLTETIIMEEIVKTIIKIEKDVIFHNNDQIKVLRIGFKWGIHLCKT